MNLLKYFSIIIAMISVACNSQIHGESTSPHSLDSAKNKWSALYLMAEHDSLICSAETYMLSAMKMNDSTGVATAGTYISQSYFFLEERDSTYRYIQIASDYIHGSDLWEIHAMLKNIQGLYAVKYELNYPKALTCFQDMFEYARTKELTTPQLLALSNIVSIYYVLDDKFGIEYARKAMGLIKTIPETERFTYLYESSAILSMARMDYLNGNIEKSAKHLRIADSLAVLYDIKPLESPIMLLRADISAERGNDMEAGEYYIKALRSAKDTDPSMVPLIYRNYGRFLIKTGKPRLAANIFETGVKYSKSQNSLLYMDIFLNSLSVIYARLGEPEKSNRYTIELQKYQDTIKLREMEQEFSALQLSYKSIENRYEIQKKELELIKSKRNNLIASMILATILIVSLIIWRMYRKELEHNRILVRQHQELLQRNIGNDETDRQDSRDNTERKLFEATEYLMKNEKVYRHKDISLDKLAELLQTNRSYLSKAINRYSGMSFSNYINMYRIDEAATIISNPGKEILIKQLADELGYSSTTIFSKAFVKRTGLTPTSYRKTALESKKVDIS